ncbi:MAG: 50S ribosomal protein L11 methyltransferase [Desulfomonilaceae bacterium]|nr:50S ribosomal protein L11 methyltransferase [Desulfomonilaceae bacterium]
MIPPDTLLYIYEVRGEALHDIHCPPSSYVGLWNEDEFAYLFFMKQEDGFVHDIVCRGRSDLVSRHEMKYEDWQTGLPASGIMLAGIHFVRRDHPAPPTGSVVLDPSVVFGDGNHPTTAACLTYMRDLVESETIQSMLDLGTGTGILALAGAALGIKRIVAVDKNRLAVRTAHENVAINSMSSRITVYEGEARLFLEEPFDLVAANLPFNVLRDIVPLKNAAIHRHWIVSGINEQQANVLQGLFLDQGYRFMDGRTDPPWTTFLVSGTGNYSVGP